jgi:hypothetical protein
MKVRVLEALALYDIQKPFQIREFVRMVDVTDWEREQIIKVISIWTNPKYGNPEEVIKYMHRLPNMGKGWYVKVKDYKGGSRIRKHQVAPLPAPPHRPAVKEVKKIPMKVIRVYLFGWILIWESRSSRE